MSSVITKFQENLSAGDKIYTKFTSNSLDSNRYVMLLAQMQSGKTFVYTYIMCEMHLWEKVTNFVIFSGNAEVALREQTKACLDNEDFQECYKAHLIAIGEATETPGPRNVTRMWNRMKQEINDNLSVFWGTALKKNMLPKKNTLFIWDESHFAQTQGMCPDKFLEKMEILPNGDQASLIERNNYVLSVSATPFSEASDAIHLGHTKTMITFTPSEAYMSVEKMKKNGMIVGFEVPLVCAREFMMTSDERCGSKKYGIVRIPHDGGKKKIISSTEYEDLARELGWDVRLYYETDDPRRIESIKVSKKKRSQEPMENEFIDILNQEPRRNTLILVKNHCRMGQQLPKQNISFVMETAVQSKTDVLLQGLLGRICGYHNFTNIRIGLRKSFVEDETKDEIGELNRYVNFVAKTQTGLPKVIPRKGKHLGVNYIEKVPLIPVKITTTTIDGSCDVDMLATKQINIEQILCLKAVFHEGLIQDYNKEEDRDETKQFIMDLPEKGFKKMCGKRTITKKSAVSIWTAFQTKEAAHLGTASDMALDQIGVYVARETFCGTGIKKGDIFIFRQKKRLCIGENGESTTKIPQTKKKEVFCRTTENGDLIATNGQCSEDLDPGTSNNLELMKNAIMNRIERSFQEVNGLIISRSITSNKGEDSTWSGIYVTYEVLNALKKGGVIYNEAKVKYGVKIKCSRVLLELTGVMCRIGTISW